jgi:hypothetical protein
MEFLRELLGDELFAQLEKAVNEHNGNEANKDKQIKIANLGSGEYVGKGKYDALGESLKGKEAELLSANELIAELKKGTKGNEELQGKITSYESQVADLQAQLQETKIKAAIKVALLSEKAVDVDYLTFKLNEKLNEKGETLTLDENDNIKGWDALKDGLKTQFPTMFESANGSNMRVLGDNKLPTGEGDRDTVTKEQFAKMGYNARVSLREKNPELYATLTR